jgi:hypothetical protein
VTSCIDKVHGGEEKEKRKKEKKKTKRSMIVEVA